MAGRQARTKARIEWYGQRVANNVNIAMSARVRLAAQLLRDKTVANISRPVTKVRRKITRGPNKGKTLTRVVPESRSKPGEFPKADTTRLMKDIFHDMRGKLVAIVGTTLDYGAVLETSMNRSFLRRTLNEQWGRLRSVLVGRPIPGGR
jgi:hypothetical protein